ncbi:MAG: hypothetical protein AB7G13_13100 [Lautropia sp.]
MLYVVEMDLPDQSLLEEWHHWYAGHLQKLLSIPGFLSAQRFQSTASTASPYTTVYTVASAQVITGAIYREKAGPASSGKWRNLMTNWKRNLLEGIDHAPDVPLGGWLAIMDRHAPAAPPVPPHMTRLRPVGLDCSIIERGILAGAGRVPPPAVREEADWLLRVCRPLTPYLTPGR